MQFKISYKRIIFYIIAFISFTLLVISCNANKDSLDVRKNELQETEDALSATLQSLDESSIEMDEDKVTSIETITLDNIGYLSDIHEIAGRYVEYAVWSPIGEKIAINELVGKVWIHDIGNFNAEPILIDHETYLGDLNFSPDGSIIATVCNGVVQIWNAIDGSLIATPRPAYGAYIIEIEFRNDGKILAIGGGNYSEGIGADSGIALLSLGNYEEIEWLSGHQGEIDLAFDINDRYLFSIDNHGNIQLWDASLHELNFQYKHEYAIDPAKIVGFTKDSKFVVYRFSTTVFALDINNHEIFEIEDANWVAVNPRSQSIAVGNTEDDLWMIDLTQRKILWEIHEHGDIYDQGEIMLLTFDSTGKILAIGYLYSYSVMFRDASTGEEYKYIEINSDYTNWFGFSPDGRFFATIGQTTEDEIEGITTIFNIVRE